MSCSKPPAIRTYFSKGKRSCEDEYRCLKRPVTLGISKYCCGDERLNRNVFFENIQNNPDSFITVWRTTLPDEEIQLPIGGDVNFYVLWGDGTFNKITSSANLVTHRYLKPGDYTVVIFGSVEVWSNFLIPLFSVRSSLIDVIQFGRIGLKRLNFRDNKSITKFSALDTPQSTIEDMSFMFTDATDANPDLSDWDLSNVTTIEAFFRNASNANPDVSRWDTSNVRDMDESFRNAIKAVPDVSNWNTSNVTSMDSMFAFASLANPDVSRWDVSRVEFMSNMFDSATNANPDISLWTPSFGLSELDQFMRSSGFNQENYNKALIMFNNNSVIEDVTWGNPTGASGVAITGNTGTPNAFAAYTNLTDNRGWEIF